MPIPDKQKLPATPEPDRKIIAEQEENLIADENEEGGAGSSEVAMRFNLLGKLIIPPSAP